MSTEEFNALYERIRKGLESSKASEIVRTEVLELMARLKDVVNQGEMSTEDGTAFLKKLAVAVYLDIDKDKAEAQQA